LIFQLLYSVCDSLAERREDGFRFFDCGALSKDIRQLNLRIMPQF